MQKNPIIIPLSSILEIKKAVNGCVVTYKNLSEMKVIKIFNTFDEVSSKLQKNSNLLV